MREARRIAALGGRVSVVYFLRAGEAGPIKIGVSTTAGVQQRIATLQSGNPEPLRLLKMIPGDTKDEATLHRDLAEYRMSGEWFEPAPAVLKAVQAA